MEYRAEIQVNQVWYFSREFVAQGNDEALIRAKEKVVHFKENPPSDRITLKDPYPVLRRVLRRRTHMRSKNDWEIVWDPEDLI